MNENTKVYLKQWKTVNREHINCYQKAYLTTHNIRVNCDVCSGHYKKYFKATHENTKLHKKASNS